MGSAALLYLLSWGSLLLYFSSAYGEYVGIINGTKVKEDSRPYMVSVQRNRRHVCGGFLVNERFVMTAAHCFKDKEKENIWEVTVVVGSHNIENKKTASRKDVKEHHIHHKYNPKTCDNDIALLQLEEGIKKSKSVSWIALPDKDKDIKSASDCSVAGWGATDTNGRANVHFLLETNVVVMQRKECKKKWKSLTEEQICASGEGGFCSGDSGGPLVCNGKAEGIVSFYQMNNCDKPTKPNVYTRVSAYLYWINHILKNPKN